MDAPPDLTSLAARLDAVAAELESLPRGGALFSSVRWTSLARDGVADSLAGLDAALARHVGTLHEIARRCRTADPRALL